MGLFSRFERRVEDGFEGMNDKLFDAPISPVQIAKKSEKQMRREKMVGAGKEFAPTLYTILVNPDDDGRLFGYYPTLAGETETYLRAKAAEEGLVMDGAPLVRFIVDEELKSGKFDVIAEMVSAPIIEQLRDEEMERYGLQPVGSAASVQVPAPAPAPAQRPQAYAPDRPYTSSGIDVMAEDHALASSIAEPVVIPNTTRFAGEAPVSGGAVIQGEPHLVNLTTGRSFPLHATRILIGRAIECDIVLDDLNASRIHAEIRCESPAVWGVADLGSTNGTLVNGKHIASVILNEGDRVTVGTTTFLYTSH